MTLAKFHEAETSRPPGVRQDEWSSADLAPLEGTRFEMPLDDGRTESLTLISVTSNPKFAREGGRIPFSLVFRSDDRDHHVPQGCRPLRHDILGQTEIFLVPIGPDAAGMCYEAVFS